MIDSTNLEKPFRALADGRADRLIWYLAAVLMLLAINPYTGIVHDNVLYFGQIAYRLFPDYMAYDPFFSFGSQDQFSIFSLVFSPLYTVLPVWFANIILVFTFLVIYATILWLIGKKLFSNTIQSFAFVFAVAMSGYYEPFNVFSVHESFFTARLPAECLVLIAAYCWLNGMRWMGLIAMFLATTMHPLMALPAIAIAFICHYGWRRALVSAVFVMVVCAFLGCINIKPFNMLFQSYDQIWLERLKQANAHMFLSNYGWEGFSAILGNWLLVAYGGLFVKWRLAYLCRTAAVYVIICIVVQFIAVDLSSNVLFSSLQLFRASWLVNILASAVVVVYVWSCVSLRTRASLLSCSLIFYGWTFQGDLSATIAIFFGLLVFFDRFDILSKLSNHLFVAIVCLCVLLLVFRFLLELSALNFAFSASGVHQAWASVGFWLALMSKSWGMLSIILMVFVACCRYKPARGFVSYILLFISLMAFTSWDNRSPNVKVFEEHIWRKNPFSEHVKTGEEVYWHDSLLGAWGVTRGPSYFATNQMAGQVFHRDTALSLAGRMEAAGKLLTQELVCRLGNAITDSDDCLIGVNVAEDLCIRRRNLRALILSAPIQGRDGVVWDLAVTDAAATKRYYLYSCDHLRNGAEQSNTVEK